MVVVVVVVGCVGEVFCLVIPAGSAGEGSYSIFWGVESFFLFFFGGGGEGGDSSSSRK